MNKFALYAFRFHDYDVVHVADLATTQTCINNAQVVAVDVIQKIVDHANTNVPATAAKIQQDWIYLTDKSAVDACIEQIRLVNPDKLQKAQQLTYSAVYCIDSDETDCYVVVAE